MRIGRASALTDTGRRRLQNEDAFVCDPPLFAVADGMGGAQAGEIASRLAAAALEERALELRGAEAVAALVQEANDRIFRHALGDPAVAGMGTTVTAMLVDERAGTIAIGHVGDSRAYRVRGRELAQLTADHSLVAELVRSGRLSPEEAEQHPHRSVITRALGTEAQVEVDALTVSMHPGDLYLLCSDGLTSMVRDTDILALLDAAGGDPERGAEALVDAANGAGGEDNITVVLFEVIDGEPPPPEPDAEPDAVTAEQAVPGGVPQRQPAPAPSVRRHGAGAGGRRLALAAVLAATVVASLLVWWGIAR